MSSAITDQTEKTQGALPPSLHSVRSAAPLTALRFVVKRNPPAAALVFLFLVAAVLGPLIAPHSQSAVNVAIRLQGPSAAHWLGTDDYGRDLFSRILGACQVAGEAAGIVILIGGSIGTVLGTVAGGIAGAADAFISRVIEIIQGFPIILLAIALVTILGPSLPHAMLAVGIGSIPDFARVARSVGVQLRDREFVQAARGAGAGRIRILRREVMPNMLGSLLVIASFDAAQAIMYESTLSFLGLGVQPPAASFGGMLSEAKSYIAIQPWYSIIVGVALALVILGLNLFGDSLSDYFELAGSR